MFLGSYYLINLILAVVYMAYEEQQAVSDEEEIVSLHSTPCEINNTKFFCSNSIQFNAMELLTVRACKVNWSNI